MGLNIPYLELALSAELVEARTFRWGVRGIGRRTGRFGNDLLPKANALPRATGCVDADSDITHTSTARLCSA
eukprot:184749-Lingulodinium_polyedra.AAC.1